MMTAPCVLKELSVIDKTSVNWTRRRAQSINGRRAPIIANFSLLSSVVPPRNCLSIAYQHGIPTGNQGGG